MKNLNSIEVKAVSGGSSTEHMFCDVEGINNQNEIYARLNFTTGIEKDKKIKIFGLLRSVLISNGNTDVKTSKKLGNKYNFQCHDLIIED